MLLRDGETAILAGLIRDEERTNKLKIPVLGDLPLIGSLFTTSTEDNDARTDVLLTITPRVIRTWEHLGGELRDIYSGTENNLTSESKYKVTAEKADIKIIKISDKTTEKAQESKQAGPAVIDAATAPAQAPAASAPAQVTGQASDVPKETILSFSEPQYIMQFGQDGVVKLVSENISGITELPLKLAFNPENVMFISAENASPGTVSDIKVDAAKAGEGVVDINLAINPDKAVDGKTELATVKFNAIKQGASYLLFLDNKITNKEGLSVNVQRTASRLVIK